MDESEVNKKLFKLVEDKTFDMPSDKKRKKSKRYLRADGMLPRLFGFIVVFDTKNNYFDYLATDDLDKYDLQ